MCRLFGMSGSPARVRATFWLLEADDSLITQSHREPDGTGLGHFSPAGRPHVDKQPVAAYEDRAFAREAHTLASTTFIAHIRYASTGAILAENTHPFEQRDRLFAHNGVIEDLGALEARLEGYLELVQGATDSERFFALVTKETDEHGGDVGAGLAAAARWVADELPLYALNVIVTTKDELWALRYPDTHDLYVLERAPGGASGARPLHHSGASGAVRVHSSDLAENPAIVLASEPMDEDPAWRPLASGELLHADSRLHISSTVAIDHPPRHPLTLGDLTAKAASSQTARASAATRPS